MSEANFSEIENSQPLKGIRPVFDTDIQKKDSFEGITRILVRGYKSLYEECGIEIRPLTILAGANSSGKSSIMQLLLLLKQMLEATYDPGILFIYGHRQNRDFS